MELNILLNRIADVHKFSLTRSHSFSIMRTPLTLSESYFASYVRTFVPALEIRKILEVYMNESFDGPIFGLRTRHRLVKISSIVIDETATKKFLIETKNTRDNSDYRLTHTTIKRLRSSQKQRAKQKPQSKIFKDASTHG